MKQLKYSRQRECIKSILDLYHDHPTADDIYMRVREQYPNISLGTVYRNLTLLKSLGEISTISLPNGGPERFDSNLEPHYHIICKKCGAVNNIIMPPLTSIIYEAANFYSGNVTAHETIFYGICPKCLAHNSI